MNIKSTIAIALSFVLAFTFLAAPAAVFAVDGNDSTAGSWELAANWGGSRTTITQNALVRHHAHPPDDVAQLAVRSRRRGNSTYSVIGHDATRREVAAKTTAGSTSTQSSHFDASRIDALRAGIFAPQTGRDLYLDVTEYAAAFDTVQLADTSDLTAELDLANTTVNEAGLGAGLIRNQTGGFSEIPFYRSPELYLFTSLLASLAGLWFCGRCRKRVRTRRPLRVPIARLEPVEK
jgi:hypothetical protein